MDQVAAIQMLSGVACWVDVLLIALPERQTATFRSEGLEEPRHPGTRHTGCAADGVLNLSTSQIPLPRDTVVVLDVRAGEGVLSRALRYECHEIIQSSLST